MSEIQVNTGDLFNASQNLNGAAGEISGAQNQVTHAPSNVGGAYDGQLRQALEAIVGEASQTGARLQNRAIDLGNELLARASAFEAANELGKSAVLGASTAYVNFIEASPTLGFLSFLSKWKEKAISIWNFGGLEIGAFLSLLFIGTKPQIVSPISNTSQGAATSSGKTGFGALLEQAAQEKEDPKNASKSAQPAETESPTQKYDTYYDIPVKAQGTLYGSAACLPTSMSMVMDYYHSSNPENQTATPDELIKMLDTGDGSSKGIGLDRLNDDLGELGYQSNVQSGSMDDLASKLNEGPVIVNAGVQLISQPARDIVQAGSTNHAILVKAMNADSVVVNDPWSGSEKTLSRETFETMWSKGGNYMVVVRPQQ